MSLVNALPIFFCAEMVADSRGFSPSAAKPAAVVGSWQRLGLPLTVHAPEPATRAELSRAHDSQFVSDVLELRRDNGFGNRSPEVAASLLWTNGAMRSAARHALRNGGAAVAPCSGFHHARWARASGFCTFNGLMVTAAALHAEGAVRIGILDCDHHYGDGTDDIISRIDAKSWLRHASAGKYFDSPSDAPEFFTWLPAVLRTFADCDVVLYQAGADPHIDDPLGGWLSTAQLYERDRLVFGSLAAARVPVAWNLAGGYQREPDGSIPKLLEIHDNSLRACAEAMLGRHHHR